MWELQVMMNDGTKSVQKYDSEPEIDPEGSFIRFETDDNELILMRSNLVASIRLRKIISKEEPPFQPEE